MTSRREGGYSGGHWTLDVRGKLLEGGTAGKLLASLLGSRIGREDGWR